MAQDPDGVGAAKVTYPTFEFEAGETIFSQGDHGDFMYLIQAGEVEIYLRQGASEQRVARLERGDFFGEMAVLEAGHRSQSARALGAAKLIKIDQEHFQHLLHRSPEITIRLFRKLSHRLHDLQDRLAQLAGQQAKLPKKAPSDAKIRLVHLSDERKDFVVFGKSEIAIGRRDPSHHIEPDIDLSAVDIHLSTSRQHAKILYKAGTYHLQEETSTNGTYLNGKRLLRGEPEQIQTGDEVRFGGVSMRVLLG